MKVMLLHHRSDFLGGAENSLVELAQALRESGVEPVCAVPGGLLAEALSEAGVRVRRVEPFLPRRTLSPFAVAKMFFARRRAAAALRAAVESVSPDIIHANSLPSQLLAAGLPGRRKRVWHVRDVPRSSALARKLANAADAVVCVSEFVWRKLLDAGVEGGKLGVIANGIDLTRFERLPSKNEARARLGVAREGFVIGCVSSLVPWKKVGLFVRGVELAREDAEMTAVLVGEAPPGAEAEAIPERPWLVRAGWRDDVPEILPAFDVFCAPSEGEPFGRNVVEAMAAGLPVVASASGGHVEVVEDGLSGVLCAPFAHGLAVVVVMLARDGEMRARLARGAKKRAKEFSVERVARATLELYDSLAREGG